MSLTEYIDAYYNGSQAAFARDIGVSSQAVSKMKAQGFIVVDGAIWSMRRVLPDPSLPPKPRNARKVRFFPRPNSIKKPS